MKNKFKKIAYPLILFIAAGILIAYAAQYYNIGNNTQQTVNEWGTGGVVYNSCGPGIFIPTNTSGEINTFISKKPTCAKLCPLVTSYNSSTTKCEATPSCSSGTYSSSIDLCVAGSNYVAVLVGGVYYGTPVWYDPSTGALRSFNTGYLAGYLTQTPQPNTYNGRSSAVFCYPDIETADLNWPYTPSAVCGYNGNNHSILGRVSQTNLGGGNYQKIMSYRRDNYMGTYAPSNGAGAWPMGYVAPSSGTYGGTYTCPSGGTLSGTTCINSTTSSAICPSGTTLNGTTDKCESVPR